MIDYDPADAEANYLEWRRSLHPDDPDWLPTIVNGTKPAAKPHLSGLVDWATFWDNDRTPEDWLTEPLLARGRSHALYAPAKAGKSLLALEVAAAIATGRSVLNQPAGQPRTVLYVDLEMTEDDLHERLLDLGYGPDVALDRLRYHLLPDLPPLDTPQGGMIVVAEAQRVAAELVIVDTVARTIVGPENESDTIRDLARYTFTPLKRAGITTLRVDHSGKDLERGQRGTSAKNDDVDVVWRLTVADNGVTLTATHRRLSWIPETVALTRTADPLSHLPSAHVWPTGTQTAATRLDELGADIEISTRAAQQLLKDAGISIRRQVVVQACKYRKVWEPPPEPPPNGTSRNHPRNHATKTSSEQHGTTTGTTGNRPPVQTGSGSSHVVGTTTEHQAGISTNDPDEDF